MVRHSVVNVTAVAQNLATALALVGSDSRCCFLSIQVLGGNAGIVYLGGAGDTLTAATAYGWRLEIPVSTVPSAPFFRESKTIAGVLDLADYQFIGTASDKISVQWEPYP